MGRRHESYYCDRHRHHNATLDAMSRALRKAACSPFFDEIECMEMPGRYIRPSFTVYDGKTDLWNM